MSDPALILPDVDTLCRLAGERAGVAAPANDSYREGLAILIADINVSGLLTEVGFDRIRKRIVSTLVTRFRVEDHIARNPHVLDVPVERPVFVLGIPRSGTTLLHNLLGKDPARRSMIKWEALNPIPPAAPGELFTDPRCRAMLDMEAAAARLPEVARINSRHFEPADGPTECALVLNHDFKSLFWDVLMPLPTYSAWIQTCDMSSAYAYLKRFLQVLQDGTALSWNLKMPSHALFIRWLVGEFPDARLIWVHRDPIEATGSMCSLIDAIHLMHTRQSNHAFLAQVMPAQLAEHLNRPMNLRESLGEDRVMDVFYRDLMRDPFATMRQVYDYLGDAFTPQEQAAMQGWLDENPQGKHGGHSYTLDQFGLSESVLKQHFAPYLSRYDAKLEHAHD